MDVDRAQNVASNCESVKLCHVAKIAAHNRHHAHQHVGGFHLASRLGPMINGIFVSYSRVPTPRSSRSHRGTKRIRLVVQWLLNVPTNYAVTNIPLIWSLIKREPFLSGA